MDDVENLPPATYDMTKVSDADLARLESILAPVADARADPVERARREAERELHRKSEQAPSDPIALHTALLAPIAPGIPAEEELPLTAKRGPMKAALR